MPGGGEVNVTWLQIGLNSACGSRYVSDILSISSHPVEGYWWRHEGLSNDPFSGPAGAMSPSKRSLRERMTSDIGGQPVQRLTSALDTCWVCWMKWIGGCNAGTIGQRHPPWLTLPLSLSRSLLHTKDHIQSKGDAWWTQIWLIFLIFHSSSQKVFNININICSIELKWEGKITKLRYDNEIRWIRTTVWNRGDL